MSKGAMTQLLNAPLPQMVEKLGLAIANAQFALDKNSIAIAQMMGDKQNHGVTLGSTTYSLLELGFAPTFYHVTEATVEAKVAFKMTQEHSISVKAQVGVNYGVVSASVEAGYSAKFGFEASGSSSITARFVSIPPPALFEERLRQSMNPPPGP